MLEGAQDIGRHGRHEFGDGVAGGIIIATADSRADIEAVIEVDPFNEAGAASYTITEFVPTMTADILSAFKQG